MGNCFGVHSDAGISNEDSDILAGANFVVPTGISFVEMGVGGLNGKLAPFGHGVPGIDGEIYKSIFKLITIHQSGPKSARQYRLYLNCLAKRAAHQLRHAGDEIVRRKDFWHERLAARKREQPMGKHRRS